MNIQFRVLSFDWESKTPLLLSLMQTNNFEGKSIRMKREKNLLWRNKNRFKKCNETIKKMVIEQKDVHTNG